MKMLILSCNTGGGHNSVAEAIRECYEANGYTVDICNCLSFISERTAGFISFSHNLIYYHFPNALADKYDESGEKHALFEPNHPSRIFLYLGKDKLGRFIQKNKYDKIICTHIFAAIMLTGAMEKFGFHIRSGIVETDYCVTPGSISNAVDLHFVSHEVLISELVRDGIPKEAIVVSGIPVKSRLRNLVEKPAAKQRLGIPEECSHILMMGGSMGCGPIPELLEALRKRFDESVHISVVCGTNVKMERELRKKTDGDRTIHIFGYMPDMSELYASSDLLVTKPGGISTTEAAAAGLPMVLINVVAGAEEYNLKFFTEQGGACTGGNVQELADSCVELIENKEKRIRMSERLKTLIKPNGAEIIYQNL